MRAAVTAEQRRRERYGDIRPIIHTEAWGKRLIAVDNRIFFYDNVRNVADFLIQYMPHACGSGWWEKERGKASGERHTILKWYDHLVAMQEPDANGMCSAVCDGVISAFFCLAYDLYVLRNHATLQKEVVARLRRPEPYKFSGARYELLVAATFLRAGFDIQYEDETDPSRKHPEFLATHKATKFTLAVEAKARHRDTDSSVERPKAGMWGLLADALEKRGEHPYVVFAELNLPPDDASQPPSWLPEVDDTVKRLVAEKAPGQSPFDLVFFTNTPHHYGMPGKPDPPKHFASWIPLKPPSRIPEAIHVALAEAIQQYGDIPWELPDA